MKKKKVERPNYSRNNTLLDENQKSHSIPEVSQNQQKQTSPYQSENKKTCLSKLANINFELAMTECLILLQKVAKQ